MPEVLDFPENESGVTALPAVAPIERDTRMTRKSFWFVFALAIATAATLVASADARPKKKKQAERISGPPTLSLTSDVTTIRACEDARVRLVATARSVDGGRIRYRWTTSAGRLTGDAAEVTWDLAGAAAGVYQAMVEVSDERYLDCAAFSSTSIVVAECPPPRPVCPTVNISCPDSVTEGAPVTFTANVTGGTGKITPTYNWTISAGRITSGQGTLSITVDTTGMAGQTIRADLDVAGFGMPCPASCSVSIPTVIKSRKFDEYYDIARNDEKARLDNYAIQLQSEPGSQGYVIVYPSRTAKPNDAQARAKRISDYLVTARGIDASRFTITMGPPREGWVVELWIAPAGATPPTPQR